MISKELESNYQNIDLETIEQKESKTIGGEWLVKQVFDALEIPILLGKIGLNTKQLAIAQQLLIVRLLYPSSELETERWLEEDSATSELYSQTKTTRYLLYQVVNFIRTKLKKNGINDSWTRIVQKMKSMQSSIVLVNNDKQESIYIKLCTRPSLYQKQIFDA